MNKEKTTNYGNYEDMAKVAQTFKENFIRFRNKYSNELSISDVQRESIDMIMTKLARICCGDPDYMDSWVDIAGYAMLVVEDNDRIKKLGLED